MNRHDSICTFNLDDCIKTLGLEERGRVQRVVDETFLTGVENFVPQDTGALIDSARRKSIVGSGEIVWDVDNKARRLYYHPEYNFAEKGDSESGGTGRGAYWADRYMQNGGRDEIEQAARKAVKE